MSLEPLPPNLEQGVDQFAREQHMSHDEAIRTLLAKALKQTSKTKPQTASSEESKAALEARGRRSAMRQQVREERVKSRPETPDELIGYLADAPEVAENIRNLAQERRSQSFGSM